MFYRFRYQIIRPLVVIWLAIMGASVVLWAIAWSRLCQGIDASAQAESPGIPSARGEATRRNLTAVYRITVLAGFMGLGTGVLALYFYRVDYQQERAQRKLLEEKLHAEEAVKEKSAFLANMSHEIRTPMNAILGFSELLEPEGLTPKQSQYVRAIRDSGASLLQLINDILDLSKIEAGRLELHPDPTDLRDSFEFLRTVFGEQAVKKSLQLHFDLAPDLPPALLLDRLRLRQVLVNLLGNAVKFTERGYVKTRVLWQRENGGSTGTLLIDVEDTGIGIPQDKLQEIFDSFVQADSGRDAEIHGTGLGLTIARRLTDMMKGTLTVESKEGQGSIFHLRFSNVPVSARLSVGDHAEPEGAVDFNDFAPATLLVVDDNKINRYLMMGMFEKTHHQLRFASNGKEALQRLDGAKFDVVLLDIRMPVMDGPTALAEIRKRPELASLPVIAITASSKASDDAELRSRFSGYIRKPFSRQTLFGVLAQFLQRVPRQVSTAAQNPSEAAPPVLSPPPERLAQWQALVLDLRSLEGSRWPAVSDSLAINETRGFAQKLLALAHVAQCGLLTTYAATLTTLADAYAIGEMERHLAGFPKLVDSIAGSCAHA